MKSDENHLHGILHSAKLLEDILRVRLTPLNILPRQARILSAIRELEPISQSRLAKIFEVTHPSMSTMIERLVTSGFVTRKTDPTTRRQNVIQLTKAGHDKIDAIHECWSSVDQTIQNTLGPKDAQAFFQLSRRLRDGLGGHPPGRDGG